MKSTSLTKVPTQNVAPLEVAARQVLTLEKVLVPHETWLKTKDLAPAKIEEASRVVVAVRELIDTAEKGRKSLTAPLLEEKRDIDAAYKGFSTRAEKIDAHVGRLLVVADAQARSKARAEAEKVAKKLEKNGAEQAAEDVRERAASTTAIGGSGLTTFTTITAKVVDLKKLCAAVAEGTAPLEVIEAVPSKLNALIRAGVIVPGVERIETTDVKRTA